MAVYAWCKKCGCRRDATEVGGGECVDKSAHKKTVAWRADVNFGDGLRLRKFFITKENADSQERQWYTDHERQELRPRKEAIVTFKTVADKYYNEHAKLKCRNPEKTTFYHVEHLKEWIGDRKISPLSDEELMKFKLDMEQLQRTLESGGRTGATVNRIFKVLRSILERAREWGIIKVSPVEFVKDVEEDEPPLRFLEIEEIERLRRAVENLAAYVKDKNEREERTGNNRVPEITPEQVDRLKDRVTVYLHTGARPSSMEECNWDNGDVDLTNRVIWFTTYKGGRRRKKHRYPHPIDNDLYQVLLRRAEVTGKKGPVFDCTGLRELEVLAIEASGVNEGKTEKQWFTMYGLKHCYASHLLMNGASEVEVAKLLGHTDTRMVHKHYGHLTLGHLRKVQERINLTPPLLNIIRPDDDIRRQGNQN